MKTAVRPELTPLPERMVCLPLDDRGYPIPAFVGVNQAGERDFRFMDQRHWVRCVKDGICWVCGGRLGKFKAFAIGPMCTVTRTTSEPACHRECAEWSARNCPFLSRPRMVRREDEMTREAEANVAGYNIGRNPGVACIWITKTFTVWRDDQDRPLITVGEPEHVEWWAEARKATRDEVSWSFTTGLPKLEELAQQEGDDAIKALHQQVGVAVRWWPRE